MSASNGLNRDTGRELTGWDHVRQSIHVILTTPIGSRLMRREFGSDVPALVDRTMTAQNILRVYHAVAVALARWEPRFSLTRCNVQDANAGGQIVLEVKGHYMPRGHLGDRTIEAEGTALVLLSRAAA